MKRLTDVIKFRSGIWGADEFENLKSFAEITCPGKPSGAARYREEQGEEGQ